MSMPLAPFPPGLARQMLGVTKHQLDVVVDGGLIKVVAATSGGQRRLDPNDVLARHASPYAVLPWPGEQPDLAVMLGGLRPDPNGVANQRTHAGFHVDAANMGFTSQQIDDAFLGLWAVNPNPYIGAALVGVLGSFVVVERTIVGYQRIGGKIRFIAAPPTPETVDRYRGKRIATKRGPVFQALGG